MRRLPSMRGVARLVLVTCVVAMCPAGCTVQSFDYRATVTFSPSVGTVRLNHQPVATGAVWAASYASFADALRDPSIVEIGDHATAIGPDACARACMRCDFDRASLAFTLDGELAGVTGTCGTGDRVVEVPLTAGP
jgi:hypothetical protein